MRLIDADALEKEFCHDCLNDYTDCIDCAIANAPTVCKWHDPDEELPKKDGEYLCLSPLESGKWRIDIYRWKQKYFVWTHPKYGEGLVTGMYWWMEIPPMPEMEKEQ